MENILKNKTILITGGGSGIGEAFALELANDNVVVICGRNEAKLKKAVAKHKNILYEVVDISDYNSIDDLFTRIKDKKIVLDVLFNNAGVVERWELDKKSLTSKEIFEKASTNYTGGIAITQRFINQANQLIENLIINNTSEVALMPVSILPLYSASKAGFSVFTQALRVQLKHTKFKVIELLTPGTDTDMPKSLNNSEKLISPNDFAKGAIKYIKKGKMVYAPGSNIPILKIFRRFAPNVGINLIDKMSRKQLAQ